MKVGDLVRYTPEGRVVNRWADWYGLIVGPSKAEFMVIVMWNKDNNNTLPIRKKDLTIIDGNQARRPSETNR